MTTSINFFINFRCQKLFVYIIILKRFTKFENYSSKIKLLKHVIKDIKDIHDIKAKVSLELSTVKFFVYFKNDRKTFCCVTSAPNICC